MPYLLGTRLSHQEMLHRRRHYSGTTLYTLDSLVPVLPQDVVVPDQLELLVHVADPVLAVHEVEGKVSLVSQGYLSGLAHGAL